MLKTRIIGVLILRAGIIVQSIGFERYLPVGSPYVALDYLNRWGIDEIVLLDIDATKEERLPNKGLLNRCCELCHVPITVGGGIRSVSDVEYVIRSGGDKVVINSAAFENPNLVSEAVEVFGNQCVMVSLDVRRHENAYRVFTHSGRRETGVELTEMAKRVEGAGAGEILVNSIDRDGSGVGYDIDLLEAILSVVTIPVILCGGVGSASHFVPAAQRGVSALAAANFFHWFEHSVIAAKQYLKRHGVDVRVDTYADYEDCPLNDAGRVSKIDDTVLEKLRFEYMPMEVI
jgi:imidazole glycerol-phosphate synthase subunit HisF